MKFHKKLGVFEACKKVREDFFDTLKKLRMLLHPQFFSFSRPLRADSACA